MKKYLIILISFLFLLPFSNAQVKSYFGGTLNVYASSGTSPEYTIQGFFNDTSGEYPLDSVAVGDIIYVSEGATCVRLRVDTINSSAGGILDADVYDVDTILLSPPSGIGALMRETENIALPRYISGLSETLLSCIRTHMTGKVDEEVANIDSLFIVADSLRVLGDKSAPILVPVFDRVTQLNNCTTSETVATGFLLIDDTAIDEGVITFEINASPASITYDVYNSDSTSYYFETATARTANTYFWEVGYTDADGNFVGDLNSFYVIAGRPDTVSTLLQDSIWVTRVCGTEISRDTISPVPSDNITGIGTTNRTALWTAANTIGNSYLLQSASALTLDASKIFQITGMATASFPAPIAGGLGYDTDEGAFLGSDGVDWFRLSPWERDVSGNISFDGNLASGIVVDIQNPAATATWGIQVGTVSFRQGVSSGIARISATVRAET